MLQKLLVLLAAMAAAITACTAPARAGEGLRATYQLGDSGFSMILEIDDNGDLRGVTPGRDLALLKIGGRNYYILGDGASPQVINVEIAAELMAEAISPELAEILATAEMPPMVFEPVGEVIVNGRTGIGYRQVRAGEGGLVPFVISDDPAIAQLADAMRAQFETATRMLPVPMEVMGGPVMDLLARGAPLRFAGTELTTVEQVTFPPDSFVLPSAPLNKQATRALMIVRGMLPADGQLRLPSNGE